MKTRAAESPTCAAGACDLGGSDLLARVFSRTKRYAGRGATIPSKYRGPDLRIRLVLVDRGAGMGSELDIVFRLEYQNQPNAGIRVLNSKIPIQRPNSVHPNTA